MAKISTIIAREILDSRGNPTVETAVTTDTGVTGTASVPSGASTGTHEAVELRDNDEKRYSGKGVLKAVANVNDTIAKALTGMDVTAQKDIDTRMCEIDGTENKGKLGANAILSVSLASAAAAAKDAKMELFSYISHIFGGTQIGGAQVSPLFNVINGGLHGGGNIDFQEFMLIPDPSKPFTEKLLIGTQLYHALKKKLHDNHLSVSVGDEGGFAPDLPSNRDALQLLAEVIENAGLNLGKDILIGLDLAASTFYRDGMYHIKEKKEPLGSVAFVDYLAELQETYRIYSFEDLLTEDDWEGWQMATKKLGSVSRIVGDDLLVTNPHRLSKAIAQESCNSILVKVNQIGTVSETLDVVRMAKQAGFTTIISHRSGETTDDFIADLAVGVGADFVKFGSPARGERVCKYNRLLHIYNELPHG